jgi:hypothetical protein
VPPPDISLGAVLAAADVLNPEKVIEAKYKSLGGAQGVLGAPTSSLGTTPGGIGHYRHYSGGSIYHTFPTGAHVVWGAILEKWESLGWEQSPLGFPTTDEIQTPDGIGRYNHFEGGSVYWTPQTGAHVVWGAILEKWRDLGWEKSVVGYPTSDEGGAPDGIGRYNHFERGSIYWTPQTGAHEVHGAIHDFWEAQGWEQGELGYPVSDEMDLPGGGRRSVFQGGTVAWNSSTGAYPASNVPVSKLHLRVLDVHCIDETGSPPFGEIGADDMKLGGTAISPYGEGSMDTLDLGEYDDGTWSKWAPKTLHTFDVNQNDSIWPKGFIVTMILIEKDQGGYSEFMKKVMTKAEELAKQALAEAGSSGSPLGWAAELIGPYVVDKVFKAIKDIFDDDIFVPITVYSELPGPQALFANNTYDSEDGYCWAKGHNGHYEWWYDWAVE